MILPTNGRVIIIDDEKDQAFPLISALSKYNISTTYFDGTFELLPEVKFSDARIIFLDINLQGTSQPNWATEKGHIISLISNIIEPKTPYILFIWSVKSKDPNADSEEGKTLFQEVAELFDNELIDFKPLIPPLEMEKGNLFKQEIIQKEGEEDQLKWELQYPPNETIELIKSKIEEGITQIDSIEALLKWENIVAEASSQTFNEIVTLASANGELNKSLKEIYYKLAEAFLGKQIKGKNHHEITNKAILMLNHLLSDKIETAVLQGIDYQIITEFKEPEEFNIINKAKLNSKILLNFDIVSDTLPGDTFKVIEENHNNFPFKGIIADLLNIPSVTKAFYETTEEKLLTPDINIIEYKNRNRKAYEAFEKNLRNEIKRSSEFINLEVSPICDYAQKKWRSNRVCPGVLWDEEYFTFIGSADSLYFSPPIYVDEKIYRLVLDFRYFGSYPFDQFNDHTPIFTLRHSILVDIQSQLGRHVNRPGISALL